MYDVLFQNVTLVDGTGAPRKQADLAIEGGRIAAIAEPGGVSAREARELVPGEGLILTPGFIDIHSHSDTTIFAYPQAESRILQGVTTELTGNCGISAAPVSQDPALRKMLLDYVGDLPYTWQTVGQFLQALEETRPSVNLGFAVGHGTLRIAAMGFDDREPTEAEMETMERLLDQALADGAYAMSSGLIYPPGCYCQTKELLQLAKHLPAYGAFYCTHMRNEREKLVESVQEAIVIARGAGAALQISHHKALYKPNWQKLCFQSTALIEGARAEGLDVLCDQYPYIATATSLDSNVPNWAFAGGVEALLARLQDPETRAKLRAETNESHRGRWQDICVSYVKSEKNKWVQGKSLLEIARIQGKDPADACFDLLIEEKCRAGEVNTSMCEEDVEYIMAKPYVMTGSDGNAFSMDYDGQPHPRAFGTFPRVIAHYSRDRGLFPLEEAIRKMTTLPASRLGLTDRGSLKPGAWADLVLLDLDKLEDTPTYAAPMAPCQGIRRVYVNGVLAAQDGVHTGARAGQVLRHSKG